MNALDIELLKLAAQIAAQEKNHLKLMSRLKLAQDADLLTVVLAIAQELRNALEMVAAPPMP